MKVQLLNIVSNIVKKKKLLIMSNISFSYNVIKSRLLQRQRKSSVLEKGVKITRWTYLFIYLSESCHRHTLVKYYYWLFYVQDLFSPTSYSWLVLTKQTIRYIYSKSPLSNTSGQSWYEALHIGIVFVYVSWIPKNVWLTAIFKIVSV